MNKLERKRVSIAIGYLKAIRGSVTEEEKKKFLLFVDLFSVRKRGKPVFGFEYEVENGKIKCIPDFQEEDTEIRLEYFSTAELNLIDLIAENLDRFSYCKNGKVNLAENLNGLLKEIYEGYLLVKEIAR